jgi:virulence-associated protein VagC
MTTATNIKSIEFKLEEKEIQLFVNGEQVVIVPWGCLSNRASEN